MTKQQVTGHCYMEKSWATDKWVPTVYSYKLDESERRVYFGMQTIAIDVPDNFDPVPAQVAALQAEKAALVEKHGNELASINERLSKLLSITNEVSA